MDGLWSYFFSCKTINDFQICVPQNKEMTSWNSRKDMMFIRVTITHDEIDKGKLIVLFSKPLQPEYFAINYLDTEIKFRQKEFFKTSNWEFTIPSIKDDGANNTHSRDFSDDQ